MLFVLTLYADETKIQPDKTVKESKAATYIEVSDVPASASQVIVDIKDISKVLEAQKEVMEIHTSLPAYLDSMETLLEDPNNQQLETNTVPELLKKENEWNVYLKQFEKWNSVLNKRIDMFEAKKKILQNYAQLWQETSKNAKTLLAPEAIIDQVTDVLERIERLRISSKKRYDSLLTDSNAINGMILDLKELLNKLKEAMSTVTNRIFYQNELPLSDLFSEKGFTTLSYFSTIYRTMHEKMNSFVIYYKDNTTKLYFFASYSLILFIFTMIFYYKYRRKTLFIHNDSYREKKYFFILRPISSFLILMVLMNVFMFEDIPQTAKQFQFLFLLLPIFRIAQTLIPKATRKYLYAYALLYCLSLIERYAIDTSLDARIFSITLSTGLFVFIFMLVKNRILDSISHAFILKFIYKIFVLLGVLLVLAIGVDIYGATLLASRITHSIFIAMYGSILFYVLTVILTGYLIVLLRRRIASSSLLMDNFTKSVEKNTVLLIKTVMLFWWFLVVSRSVGLFDTLMQFKDSIMALSWMIGTTTISVTSIFDFILIILLTWFVVKFLNIILEVEVYARFKFARGVPTAITTVLNYTIVISGAFIALSSLGISSEQFTLVFGALGVGIGFGLRNIIANFVSGIIMVFERPIQIGDTIEINSTMGTVDHIGTRSSTIKTFDGSEVIIPNADFISKEITNWTLSDKRRRKTLLFKVAQNADIRKVLKIMERVVNSHPDVIKDPEPLATFLGFGEYYLEFKLYFWLHENLIMAQSDIAIDIYESLQKEGIAMPTPKQEFLQHGTD